jgi:hypothetical protein
LRPGDYLNGVYFLYLTNKEEVVNILLVIWMKNINFPIDYKYNTINQKFVNATGAAILTNYSLYKTTT